jgi:hypothetical protein
VVLVVDISVVGVEIYSLLLLLASIVEGEDVALNLFLLLLLLLGIDLDHFSILSV